MTQVIQCNTLMIQIQNLIPITQIIGLNIHNSMRYTNDSNSKFNTNDTVLNNHNMINN